MIKPCAHETKMPRSILYILTRSPVPVNSGRQRMIAQTCEYLLSIGQLHIAYFGEGKDAELIKAKFPEIRSIHLLPKPGIIHQIMNLIGRPAHALQESLFYSVRSERQIGHIVDKENIDLIVTDMIRCAQLVEKLPVPKICELDDLLSNRYMRAIEDESSHGSIFGVFASKVPRFLSVLVSVLGRRVIYKIEASRIRKREMQIASTFDAVSLVSSTEAEILARRVPEGKIYSIPPIVRASGDHVDIRTHDEQTPRFSFLGNFFYMQNVAALDFIVSEILPRIHEHGLVPQLDVIGPVPESLKAQYAGNDNVIFHGFVESVESIIARSLLFLSPITSGSGVKTKILEAMALGVPVITNEIGAEGIGGEDGVSYIVRNEACEIAEQCIRLCKSRALRSSIGEQGRRFVMRHFSQESVNASYKDMINSALQGPASKNI